MPATAISRNGTTIRLTDERWAHIAEEHGELVDLRTEVLDTVSRPERVLAGGEDELLAVREIEPGQEMVVVYRELGADGFIITAFLTRRIRSLAKGKPLVP